MPDVPIVGYEGGKKHDQEKVRLDLLPPRPLVEIAEVLTDGAREYGEYNWALGLKFSRLKAALDGHLMAWWSGEDRDPESGRSHLAHAGCCLLFMMDLRHRNPGMDDRPMDMVAKAFPEGEGRRMPANKVPDAQPMPVEAMSGVDRMADRIERSGRLTMIAAAREKPGRGRPRKRSS